MAEVAIVHADTEGRIRSWNAGAEALFGHPAAEAVGKTLDLIVPEPYREAHWRGFRAAVAARKTSQDEPFVLPILCRDGVARPFAGRLVFIRDAYDRAVGAMGVFVADEPSAAATELYRL
ncbi:MAG TPA: PAS domain S-box protein [Rhizomicrobium sp.]|jgi:PAS domain S-box-containing protein|nr:PAS domain S-box protein [Rhizomicrobium sp.]